MSDETASDTNDRSRKAGSAPNVQHHDLHDCVIAERFEVTDLIGLGGMGAVWQARDRKLERTVAIKVLPPMLTRHRQYRERFLREAQAAAKLCEHPHIVPVYHCGLDRERESLYLAMRLVRGISLRDRVNQSGPLPQEEALPMMREILSALGFAHEHGIVHRDVKPDNILIEEASGTCRLTDFGLVRLEDAGSRLTAVGQVMGTPQWMSPEQCEAHTVDGRSDLYSAGLCFYFMLLGENPFHAPSTAQVFVNQLQKAAPSLCETNPAIAEPLERFVLILLAKAPSRRFADAQAALRALEQVERGELPARPSASTSSHQVSAIPRELAAAAEQARRQSSNEAATTVAPAPVAVTPPEPAEPAQRGTSRQRSAARGKDGPAKTHAPKRPATRAGATGGGTARHRPHRARGARATHNLSRTRPRPAGGASSTAWIAGGSATAIVLLALLLLLSC